MLIISNIGRESNQPEGNSLATQSIGETESFTGILALYSTIFSTQDNSNNCFLNNDFDATTEELLKNCPTPQKIVRNRFFEKIDSLNNMINLDKLTQSIESANIKETYIQREQPDLAQLVSELQETTNVDYINNEDTWNIYKKENEQKEIYTFNQDHCILESSNTLTNVEVFTNESLKIDSSIKEQRLDISTPSEDIELVMGLPVTQQDFSLSESILIHHNNEGLNMQIQENMEMSESFSELPLSRIKSASVTSTTTEENELDTKEIYSEKISIERIVNPNKETDLRLSSRPNQPRPKAEIILEEFKGNTISADIIFDRGKLDIMNINEKNPNQIVKSSLLNQIVERIDISFKDGKSIAEMHLIPDTFGSIEIEAIIKDKTIKLNIITEKSETNRLLLSKTNELSTLLSEKGFKVKHINVSGKTESYTNNSNEAGHRQGYENKDTNQNQHNRYISSILTGSKTIKEHDPVLVTSHKGSINIYI